MIGTGRICGVFVRYLESIANVHTPRFEFLVGPGWDGVYEALWRAFCERAHEWDVLRLLSVPLGSPTLAEMSRQASMSGAPVGLWTGEESPYVPVRGGWEGYWATCRPRHRANVRRHRRRCMDMGPFEREVITDGELEPALDEGFAIEGAAWKKDAGTAIASDPRVEGFYRRLASRTARRGWLRLTFLRVAGMRVAFAYSLVYRRRWRLLKTGYLPRLATQSPSTLLCAADLQDAFSEDCLEFDFLGDKDPSKLEWASRLRPHRWLFAFARPGLLRLLHPIKFRVIPALKRAPAYARIRERALELLGMGRAGVRV
jgi:hypothetical protein